MKSFWAHNLPRSQWAVRSGVECGSDSFLIDWRMMVRTCSDPFIFIFNTKEWILRIPRGRERKRRFFIITCDNIRRICPFSFLCIEYDLLYTAIGGVKWGMHASVETRKKLCLRWRGKRERGGIIMMPTCTPDDMCTMLRWVFLWGVGRIAEWVLEIRGMVKCCCKTSKLCF